MKKITTIFLAVVALLTSCKKSPIELGTPEEAREAIELSLGALTVDRMGAGTAEAAQQEDETIPLTKTSLSAEPLTTIKNLWVLQFSNQGLIIGEPQYLDSFDSESDNKIKLIPTGEDSECTIVYLANTFDKSLIKSNCSINDVKALSHSITDEESNFITTNKDGNVIPDTDGNATPDTEKSRYMIMYGSIEQSITSDATLSECTLKRTVAKITVNIILGQDKSGNKPDLTFLSVEMDGVPNKSHYYPTFGIAEEHPADGTFHTIDYQPESIENITTFSFYVPTNRRGVVNNSSQLSKNHFGTHDKTSINIIAKDVSGNTYCYTFFLGANLTDNFNIDCDKEYKYNLTFNHKGDPEYDERVTLLNSIDYTKESIERSNCYILNPSDLTDRTIYIPIDRIDNFWSAQYEYTEEGHYVAHNTLTNVGDNWEAVLMWHDSDDYTFDKETQSLGGLKVEGDTRPSGMPCVKVTLPRYYKHCNVGFVVRRTDEEHEGVILWSWHLWITDYNPYPKELLPSLTIGHYDVDGGALHRYKSSPFMGGIYSDKFIMDRNIGARSADFEGHGSIGGSTTVSAGSLYYQFGRKDPFPSKATYVNGYEQPFVVSYSQNFEYSVNNPEKFIYNANGNWCRNGNDPNYIWNDYKIEAEGYTSGKSIFDPSPLGFRLPTSDIWDDFKGFNVLSNAIFMWTPSQTSASIIEKYNYGSLYTGYTGISGPTGYDDFPYYPASGRMPDGDKVSIGYKGTNGYCWSANPSSEDNGQYLVFGAGFLHNPTSGVRAMGYPVRPIQE